MKRFKNLIVYLSSDSSDKTLIRYLAEFVSLCESLNIRWIAENPTETKATLVYPAKESIPACTNSPHTVFEGFWDGPYLPDSRYEYIQGNPVTELCRIASQQPTDLIITSQQTFDPRSREQLVRSAPCSVMLVSPCSTPHFRKILVPVDFSETSRQCAVIGANLAKTRSVNRLFLYHAFSVPLSWHAAEGSFESKRLSYAQKIRREMQQWKQDLETESMAMNCHLSMEYVPWSGISKFGEQLQPDLVIMGSENQGAEKCTKGKTIPKVMANLNTTILVHRSPRWGHFETSDSDDRLRPKAA